ncbi:hypothetical protein F383_35670 [Gossypium arboreum]|uniref:Uncharacterized protein n=1 Tax=Gossypium arboreum TaxID=29729 RepID=A0A0B0PXY5_GOSAR|nr:hypothetical protein F383_35670 [Gossypium arboreum]
MGRPHGHVNLAESKHDSHGWTTHPCLFNRLDYGLEQSHMGVSLPSPSLVQFEKGQF